MKSLGIFVVVATVLFVSAPRVAARPITLDETYTAALKASEAVAERGETYAQVLAQIDQIWAAVMPRVMLNGVQQWQDTPGPGVNFPLPASQQTVAVAVHQPLFAGLRDFLAVRETHALGDSAELALRRAKQLLYADVTSAYLALLGARQNIATRRKQVQLTLDRVKELRGFERIGRSRRSETLAAESQTAQAEADLAAAVGAERLQQATLRFLTKIEEDLEPADIPAPEGVSETQFLERSRRRPDVEAARRDLDAAQTFVTMQGRQRLPTVFIDGNYYLRRPPNYSRHINWDAALTAQLPVFTGGLISAQVREARAQERYREQALSLAMRQAELETRSAHSDLVSQLEVVAALQKALSLAEANAKAQAADYRNGLVTNIEVLTSLTTVEDTSLRLDAARRQAVLSRVRLEVAAGGPESVK